VLGRSSAAQTVAVVSLHDGTVEDEFLAYRVSPSPTKRFIAYERFWQPQGPQSDRVVMIYDLERTANQNRRSHRAGRDQLKYVGIPVFPQRHNQSRDYLDDQEPNAERPITQFCGWMTRPSRLFRTARVKAL
jgi:hypothetical protein